MSIDFEQSTLQNQGAASDYYSGVIQCNVYVPKSKGTSVLSEISEAVIDGLTSVNASDYSDTFSCTPRVADVNGPTMLQIEDRSHFIGIIYSHYKYTLLVFLNSKHFVTIVYNALFSNFYQIL